jgi:hypothetical protein
MQNFITSFLIQRKECCLSGIGTFRITTSHSELDVANKKLFPPTDEIIFTTKGDKFSEELVKYIARKEQISEKEAHVNLKKWCKHAIGTLNTGGKIIFTSIGSLQKNATGNIFFQHQKPLTFFKEVAAERIIHKNVEHKILVGDKETTSSAMNQFLNEEQAVKNSKWKIAAIILLALALVVIFIHFYMNEWSLSSTGNQTIHLPEAPPSTYSTQ